MWTMDGGPAVWSGPAAYSLKKLEMDYVWNGLRVAL